MEDREIEEFITLLKAHTPEYRKKLLKKMKSSYKSRFRNITRKYIKEHNIKLEICANCGCGWYIEIHHLNYENPYLVSPLCKTCHGEQHRLNNEEIPYINLQTGEWFYDKFRICKDTQKDTR